jgi:hypothetical protein
MAGPEWSQKCYDCTRKRCMLGVYDSGAATSKSTLKISERWEIKVWIMNKYKHDEANPSFLRWSQNAL